MSSTLADTLDAPREGIPRGPFEVDFLGRPVRVEFTSRAIAAAAELETPLQIEMELYFSCLVRKAVRFHTTADPSRSQLPPVTLAPNLELCFRPVVTEECRVHEVEGAPPVKTMPAAHPEALIPRWLKVDHRHGEWLGEFGY